MKKVTLFLALSLTMLISCSKSTIDIQDSESHDTDQLGESIDDVSVEGVVRIKFSRELYDSFNLITTRTGVSTGIPGLDDIAEKLKIKSMTPTFPVNKKFLKRYEREGLHLWYNVTYDQSASATRAISFLDGIKGIEVVEPIYKIERYDSQFEPIELTEGLIHTLNLINGKDDSGSNLDQYFNDEYLGYQWHYNNEGAIVNFKPGADINAFQGWDIETGKPNVIVAIVDGGIQYDHPDLAQNMWVNEAELNGQLGVDDDDNGYVDDIYGYNFVYETGQINAHTHGTHVAGTVAAVNNNEIGVSGVAGGNGQANSGVRIMSCQILEKDGSGNTAAALVYACDNGAVIAQNSWGYQWGGQDQELAEADKVAIDYFIKYAGLDENNQQIGPMKGGIVIFAAGNDNISGRNMPPAYEKVLTVSAIVPNYRKAIYSNYGSWVNIAAPGGESELGAAATVLSTMPGDKYGFLEGTSMACPHVSGVAALVVSKYGQVGFTNNELWRRLMNGTNDIRPFNPDYLLGIGYINAQKALSNNGEIAPDRIHDLSIERMTFEKAELSWGITADSDSGKPYKFEIVWGKTPQWNIDMDNIPEGAQKIELRATESLQVGDQMRHVFTKLDINETYYFSVVAVDKEGNRSLSTTVFGYTIENQPPVVEGLPHSLILKRTESQVIRLKIYDPEGHKWTYVFDPNSSALTDERKGDELYLKFNALQGVPGQYVAKLTVTDEFGASMVLDIPYAILENQQPEVIQSIEEIVFYNIGQQRSINLEQYFTDADGDKLTYVLDAENTAIANYHVQENNLVITSQQYGSTPVKITAYDSAKDRVSSQFSVICRNPSQAINLYPNPIKKDGLLNIRMGEEVDGYITITLHNNAGARVLSQEVQISPTEPAQINVGDLDAGNYKVTVKYINKKYTQIITKL